ncbi:MAG: hypothetical protein EKK40_17660 [Bradyrhizobiaceae bacterium]|nr:MAG: hypothetical protein EKK40_17660 [Bradyrhizobiaceae bacterium]
MSVIHDRNESANADADLSSVTDVEAGIREFVRNDIAYLRRAPSIAESTADAGAEATVNNVNTLIQRVAGASATEIDNLINELESLRALMHEEGQRVQRDLANFAKLSQTAMKSTRIISDNLAQWKRAPQPD